MKSRALITGASTGIGYAYAKHLSKEGWILDLISENAERSMKSKNALNYPVANFYLADLSKKSSIKEIISNYETPDLIVANAGIAINGSIGKLSILIFFLRLSTYSSIQFLTVLGCSTISFNIKCLYSPLSVEPLSSDIVRIFLLIFLRLAS